ncbi:polynucleotide adenylyltransferase PcnB [Lentisphaera profundi]|uniref:Polynucleotide adenylyltransferase PcnB n=1 Tax=Lentisphaera profundi TaxID=1658616 RepID=A0ABY7VQ08_9BACT|nr:polynucleotide adenylyltransferase PcnB [Lentisphaera profundi]WDE96258.1 polynucleotide adenylyltransferase PcnB [Lentisphaera profundi]
MDNFDFNPRLDRGAVLVISKLREAGYETYLVGGAVRDLLVGENPKDFDISTSATPEEISAVFGRRKARIIGRRFKIVHVYERGTIYEVATFRRTPNEKERSARPSDDGEIVWRDNVWGSPEEDANRRDFTVNALFLDPTNKNKIIDFCGGIADIEDKKVRSLGDPMVRFTEDPVRMLRAVKLKAQYGFDFEPDVEKAIRELAPKITLVSQRRLYEEILKITYKPYMAKTMDACHQSGLLEHIMPNLSDILSSDDRDVYLNILNERDVMITKGSTLSRAYSLPILAYRYVEKRLNPGSKFGDNWEHREGIDRELRHAVNDFMKPHNMTRIIAARVKDVIMMQGRILNAHNIGKIKRHPEFFYASLLYRTMAPHLDWPEADFLPEPRLSSHHKPGNKPKSKNRRNPRKDKQEPDK